jgi:hypothetical protein
LHRAAGRVAWHLHADFDKDLHEQGQGFQRFQGQGIERRTGNAISASQTTDAAIGAAHHAAHEGEFEGPLITGAKCVGALRALVRALVK